MFPTFQLSIHGFAVCLDPALLQFMKQLPYEAYSAGTNINHTSETTQLPELTANSSIQAPPLIAAPSVVDDEAQDIAEPDLLSRVKGYATKVGHDGDTRVHWGR